MKFPSVFSADFWIEDEDVRREVQPKPPGPKAVQQARLSALALEGDRDELRADLMRQRRDLKADLEMVEHAGEEA